MLEHPLSPSTHTVELEQLRALNEALARPGAPSITVADLGLTSAGSTGSAGATGASSRPVSSDAVLVELDFDGPPEYPYIHGRFATGPAGAGDVHVELHTATLRELSRRLHLHHTWGV